MISINEGLDWCEHFMANTDFKRIEIQRTDTVSQFFFVLLLLLQYVHSIMKYVFWKSEIIY